jgi:hypothetical protein
MMGGNYKTLWKRSCDNLTCKLSPEVFSVLLYDFGTEYSQNRTQLAPYLLHTQR